jgi:DNA replication protein DnaC
MKLLYAQSNLERVLEQENFDHLTFQYYDNSQIIPEIGMTNADYMRRVVKSCMEFAQNFDSHQDNLLFTGSTGVGKTFLTNCIARKLMDTYHSVIYFSASDLFEVFSRNKFDYDQAEEMKDTYRYILDCDLLIIDDLGTELNNSFTSSQLFYCINERMNMNRSTIISTNLSLTQLRDSYTDRVTSRIMRYRIIPLYGRDIRLLKR